MLSTISIIQIFVIYALIFYSLFSIVAIQQTFPHYYNYCFILFYIFLEVCFFIKGIDHKSITEANAEIRCSPEGASISSKYEWLCRDIAIKEFTTSSSSLIIDVKLGTYGLPTSLAKPYFTYSIDLSSIPANRTPMQLEQNLFKKCNIIMSISRESDTSSDDSSPSSQPPSTSPVAVELGQHPSNPTNSSAPPLTSDPYSPYSNSTPTAPYSPFAPDTADAPLLQSEVYSPYSSPPSSPYGGYSAPTPQSDPYSNPYGNTQQSTNDTINPDTISDKNKQDMPPSYDIATSHQNDPAMTSSPSNYAPMLQPAPVVIAPQAGVSSYQPVPVTPVPVTPNPATTTTTTTATATAATIMAPTPTPASVIYAPSGFDTVVAVQNVDVDLRYERLPKKRRKDVAYYRSLNNLEKTCLGTLRYNFLSSVIGTNCNLLMYVLTGCVWMYYAHKYGDLPCSVATSNFKNVHIYGSYVALIWSILSILYSIIATISYQSCLRNKPKSMSRILKIWLFTSMLGFGIMAIFSIISLTILSKFECGSGGVQFFLMFLSACWCLALLVGFIYTCILWFKTDFDDVTKTEPRILSLKHTVMLNLPAYIIGVGLAVIALALSILILAVAATASGSKSGRR